MDLTTIIDALNEAQREAVTLPTGSALVLAGAGSGKTRVLVHRIAWLAQVEAVPLHRLMAVTFTNKAAAEMRGRVEALLHHSARGLWIGTFHGLAHRLLRRHAEAAGLPETFQILDADDQYRLIKRLLKSLNLDEGRWPPRQVQWYINGQKDEGRRPTAIAETGDPFQYQMLQLYTGYEAICQRSGLVDFAELLLRAHELLRDDAELLDHYRQRFHHLLVDEFQDTNTIQYAWLRLLTGESDNLFVVGDDDQSIYGWRGAKIENLQRFRRDYPDHRLVRLEQNYRSTATILNAANVLISNNENRLGKKLWTDGAQGEPISLYAAFNEQDEAWFVVERIKQWLEQGHRRSDAAILYRSNAQSRLFEEKLIQAGIPYRVYGGLRFFDRAEIKDALAYLRLVASRDDDASFERIVNTPPRGIGARTVEILREAARSGQQPLWRAAKNICETNALPPRALNALKQFLQLIDELENDAREIGLSDQSKQIIERSGLIPHYQKEGEKGETRIDNLKELVNATRQFEYEHGDSNDEGIPILHLFLAQAALDAGDAQAEETEEYVQLMTMHSAKGLEFKLVFMAGMEEGLFPSEQSMDEPGRLEEERRLCYVGITRAMQQLHFTFAELRRRYGRETYPKTSRFLREIPPELLQEVRMRAHVSRPLTAASPVRPSGLLDNDASFPPGQRVLHKKFGEGVVLQCEGDGSQIRVQVNFEKAGAKWLMASYANLQVV